MKQLNLQCQLILATIFNEISTVPITCRTAWVVSLVNDHLKPDASVSTFKSTKINMKFYLQFFQVIRNCIQDNTQPKSNTSTAFTQHLIHLYFSLTCSTTPPINANQLRFNLANTIGRLRTFEAAFHYITQCIDDPSFFFASSSLLNHQNQHSSTPLRLVTFYQQALHLIACMITANVTYQRTQAGSLTSRGQLFIEATRLIQLDKLVLSLFQNTANIIIASSLKKRIIALRIKTVLQYAFHLIRTTRRLQSSSQNPQNSNLNFDLKDLCLELLPHKKTSVFRTLSKQKKFNQSIKKNTSLSNSPYTTQSTSHALQRRQHSFLGKRKRMLLTFRKKPAQQPYKRIKIRSLKKDSKTLISVSSLHL